MRALILACAMTTVVMAGDKKVVPKVGDPAPDFTGTWMAYDDTSLAELQGKLVFIEFWRTW